MIGRIADRVLRLKCARVFGNRYTRLSFYLAIAGIAVASAPAYAFWASLAASPSPNTGDFDVTWSNPSSKYYHLQEMPTGGSWSNVTYTNGTSHSFTGHVSGDFSYRLKLTETECSGWPEPICYDVTTYSETIAVTVNDPPQGGGSGGDPFPPPGPFTPPSAVNFPDATIVTPNVPDGDIGMNSVGALNGSGGVSGGQASYSIPIVVPPGRKGMQPSLSLGYSSSGGNGTVGVGWGMSAGSSVSRCSATVAQDGYTASVQFDETRDRLCLDGMRLMVASGSYGQIGATYRTELESFALVEQIGGDIDDSSTYFIVTFKNGGQSWYGSTSNSRFVPAGQNETMTWAIRDQRDVSGNTVLYEYQTFGDGENHLSAIHYTGHSGLEGDRHVRFIYEANDDPRTFYMAGGKTRLTQRLKEIKTEYQSTLIRKYSLSYKSSLSTNRNLLESVEECAYENGVTPHCFPATEFEWQEGAPQYVVEELAFEDPNNLMSGSSTYVPFGNANTLADVLPRGDHGGDGVKDWNGIEVNAENEITNTHSELLANCFRPPNAFTLTCLDVDLNADGLSDEFRQNNSKFEIRLSGNPNNPWVNTGIDWDTSSFVAGIDDTPLAFSDFNGDGWPDLAMKQDSKLWIYLHSGDKTDPYDPVDGNHYHTFQNTSAGNHTTDAQVYGDMDGNGTPDFVISNIPDENDVPGLPTPTKIILTFSHPNGGITTDDTRTIPYYRTPQANANFFHDVNGDGLPDLVSMQALNTRLQYKPNDGTDFVGNWIDLGFTIPTRSVTYNSVPSGQPVWIVADYPIMSKMLVMDYDGDGRQEMLTADSTNVLASSCAYIQQTAPYSDGWYCDDELYDAYQATQFANTQDPINSAVLDNSVRKYNAHSFSEDANGNIVVTTYLTDIEASASQTAAVDATGDGLVDVITVVGCRQMPSCEFNNTFAQNESPTGAIDSRFGAGQNTWINRNKGTASATQFEAYDVMSAAEDALGNRHEWTYRPLSSDEYNRNSTWDFYAVDHGALASEDDYFHFASSMYVVAEYRGSNGIGGLNNTLYRYRGAAFNNKGRGFQGFLSIEVEEDLFPDGHADEDLDKIGLTEFEQRWPKAGIALESCTWVASNSGSLTNPTCSDVVGASYSTLGYKAISYDRTEAIHDVATVGGARFVAVKESSSRTYDLVTPSLLLTTSTTDRTFDIAGNVTFEENSHTDDWTTNSTETTSTFDIGSGPGTWTDKLLTRVVKTNPVTGRHWSSPTVTAAQDSEKMVTTSFTQYDTAHRSPTTIVVTANDTALTSTVSNVYNSYGLPTSISTTGTDVVGPRTVTTTYSKDGTTAALDGYFPLTITNALGHEVESHTDPAHGVTTDLWDANSLHLVTVHDAFGRTKDVTGPGTPTVSTRLDWCDGIIWCVSGATYRVQTYGAAMPTNRSYMDQFGRSTYAIVRSFDDTSWTKVRNTFDVRGNPVLQSVPHDTSLGDPTNPGVRFDSYDALGRVTQKRTDQANGTKLTTTYSYSGFTTDIDAGGISMQRIYNGLGQLVETRDGENGFTRYSYDGAGNPVVLQDPKMDSMAGNVGIKAAFNALGQKEWVEDPDWWNDNASTYGQKTFIYNALGEVLSEVDPNGNLIEMDYDELGRLLTRTVNGTLDGLWAYDNSDTHKGLGLLDYEDSQFQADGSRLQKFYYYSDATTGRKDLLQVTHRIYENSDQNDFEEYDTAYFTDGFYARPKGLQYPGGTSVAFEYNNDGHLIREKDPLSSVIYREVTKKGSKGEVTEADIGKHGNSFLYTRTANYFGATGQAQSITVSNGGNTVQNLSYSYDDFGNLKDRTNVHSTGTTIETLLYDNVQRLTSSSRSYGGTPPNDVVVYSYDGSGNFLSKDDYASSYSYHASRPHVLTAVNKNSGGNTVFTFDENGNMKVADGESITYNAMNKPETIQGAAGTSTFSYGADIMRYRQTTPQGTTIYYLDKLMEIEKSSSNADYRHYLGDVAILTKTGDLNDPSPGIKYLLRDRLGSVAVIGDTSGYLVESRGYDPFGKPRNGDWTDKSTPGIGSNVTNRGFTDHEHLDDWQLIHMNGRGFDYNLGRFLSIDPIIQSPASSQSINPYSYIGNNPLSGTDPTGYQADKQVKRVTTKLDKKVTTGSRIPMAKNATSGTVTTEFTDGSSVSTSVSVSENGATSISTGVNGDGTIRGSIVKIYEKADSIGSQIQTTSTSSEHSPPNSGSKDSQDSKNSALDSYREVVSVLFDNKEFVDAFSEGKKEAERLAGRRRMIDRKTLEVDYGYVVPVAAMIRQRGTRFYQDLMGILPEFYVSDVGHWVLDGATREGGWSTIVGAKPLVPVSQVERPAAIVAVYLRGGAYFPSVKSLSGLSNSWANPVPIFTFSKFGPQLYYGSNDPVSLPTD